VQDYVLSVAVSPDGQWIVSGSKDRGVSFWDPKSTAATVVLQGHKNSGAFELCFRLGANVAAKVISIAVSEAGGLLATGSGDWSCRCVPLQFAETEG
jgi:glucose repression regulatory protein TUP1